jgi:hypothetical protein
MEEIETTDDAKADILQLNLLSPWDRFRQSWIVGKSHWRSLRPYPGFGMTELCGVGEASRLKLGMGEQAICCHGDIDIERRTRFGLVNLERYAADNRIRHSDLRKNTGERQESRTLRTFHLTSQPEPLAIQNESFFESSRHHVCHHTTSAVE